MGIFFSKTRSQLSAIGEIASTLALEAGYGEGRDVAALRNGNFTRTDLGIAQMHTGDAWATTPEQKVASRQLVEMIQTRLDQMTPFEHFREDTFDNVGSHFLSTSPAGSSLDAPWGTPLWHQQRER